MFEQKAKKMIGTRYGMAQRLPVMTAGSMVVDSSYRHYLARLKGLAGLPDDHFSTFYRSALEYFISFVQLFPLEINAPLGSMLTTCMIKSANILHSFVHPKGDSSPLERYALFTACLVRDVARLVIQQKVHITDVRGCTVKIWQPFAGPLTSYPEARFYKIMPLASAAYESMTPDIRIALARQIIGEPGFLWIAGDLKLFKEWLDVLHGKDPADGGRLVNAIKRYRDQIDHAHDYIEMLSLSPVEPLDSPETEHAEAFYAWLIDGLQNKKISINSADALVHITAMGIFLTEGVFKAFAKQYSRGAADYALVFGQFDKLLGISNQAGDAVRTQLLLDYPDVTRVNTKIDFAARLNNTRGVRLDGVLVGDVNRLYLNGKPPDVSPHVRLPTGIIKSGQLSALDFGELNQSTTLKLY